jgi:hypothetical protein
LKNPDTLDLSQVKIGKGKFLNNIFQQAVNSVSRSPKQESYLHGRSEDPYLPYQGKIIRNIYIRTFNFNQSFTDTSKKEEKYWARVASRMHVNTRKFIIRNNLFVKENTPLNAYKIADNERFIRSLGYINDVRFVIHELPGNPDSVDVSVFTKDLFSIGGGASSNGFNHVKVNAYEANLAGMAQRVEVMGLYDYNRTPEFGYGALYRKNNFFGTFIDGGVGHSVMDVSPYTREEESIDFISLSRRLVSPYSAMAGGLVISRNKAYNLYNAPENIFFKYRYEYFDAWVGYNIAIKKLTATNNTYRDRRFLAVRYYNRHFTEVPQQIGLHFNPVYNSSEAALAQITFFRQNYFKTQYIYGFGTTEDLPYGYNVSVTGGWHKQLGLERPYAGITVSRYLATSGGDFIQVYMRSGAFLNKQHLQDASILVGATAYGRLLFLNSTKVRPYINVNYTHIYDRLTTHPLRLNNPFGLRGFISDSVWGDQRLSLQLEAAFYLRYKFLGFKFAPFPYADFSFITPEKQPLSKASLYTSLGGGVRMRNENLVFETIEVRAYFFPVAPDNMRGFKVIATANLHYRYPSSLITAPDFVQLN